MNTPIKHLNRNEFMVLLMQETKTKSIGKNPFRKNSFLLNGEMESLFNLEFMPQTKENLCTINFKSLRTTADKFHEFICNWIKSQKLDRRIIVNTENKVRVV